MVSPGRLLLWRRWGREDEIRLSCFRVERNAAFCCLVLHQDPSRRQRIPPASPLSAFAEWGQGESYRSPALHAHARPAEPGDDIHAVSGDLRGASPILGQRVCGKGVRKRMDRKNPSYSTMAYRPPQGHTVSGREKAAFLSNHYARRSSKRDPSQAADPSRSRAQL